MRRASFRHLVTFRLRGLFIAVTLVGAWLGWNLHRVRQREQALVTLNSPGVVFSICTDGSHPIPLAWKLLGAESLDIIVLADQPGSATQRRELQRMFPEATVVCFPGSAGQ
jgi:hypothetical protein